MVCSAGKDKATTLLDFVVEHVQAKDPRVASFFETVPHVMDATESSVKGLSAEASRVPVVPTRARVFSGPCLLFPKPQPPPHAHTL